MATRSIELGHWFTVGRSGCGQFVVAVLEIAKTAETISAENALPGACTLRAEVGRPGDYSFRACPVDTALTDGQRLTVGTLELEVLWTPGHSTGHLSYALHRVAICRGRAT